MANPKPRESHCDPKAEVAVLTAVIDPGDSGLFDKVLGMLEPRHFFYQRHAKFYDAALNLHDAGIGVTATSIKHWLEDRKTFSEEDWNLLHQLDGTPLDFHIVANAKRIIDKFKIEQVVRACEKTIAEADAYRGESKDFLDKFEARAIEATERSTAGQLMQSFSMKGLIRPLAQQLFEIGKEPPPDRCSFGIAGLDEDLGGLAKESVTIVGADTNWGKTNLAIFIADVNLLAGRRVLMVSHEDSEKIYGRRMAARRASINAARLRDMHLNADEFDRLMAMVDGLTDEPVFLKAIGVKAEPVAQKIKRMCERHKFDLVMVDYVQAARLSQRAQDRRNEVTEIARIYTDTIKNSGAAGIMFSQIRRLSREEKRPTMHHLKESGDVENGAENVLLGYRTDSAFRLLTAKGKDGCKNEYELDWDANSCCFLGGKLVEDQPTTQTQSRPKWKN